MPGFFSMDVQNPLFQFEIPNTQKNSPLSNNNGKKRKCLNPYISNNNKIKTKLKHPPIHNISINLVLSKLLISIHRLMKRKRRRNLQKQMNLKIKQRALAPPKLMPPIMPTTITMQRNRMIQALQPPHKSKIASNKISTHKRKLHFLFDAICFWVVLADGWFVCVCVYICTCTCGGFGDSVGWHSHISPMNRSNSRTHTHSSNLNPLTIHKQPFYYYNNLKRNTHATHTHKEK